MGYFASMDEANNISREAIRSAVILGKFRYDDQLAPFVRTSRERLESDLVKSELLRIAAECAYETGADAEKVYETLKVVISDVVIPVSDPEREDVTKINDGVPPVKNVKDKPEPQATTDVLDHGAVLEDEILEPEGFKRVDIESMACVRCGSVDIPEKSVVCEGCNTILVGKAKKKEALATQPGQSFNAQPAQPQAPAATTPMVPLNPNAPYQCVVCGRTGTFDDIKQHLDTAQDVDHLRAKQQQPTQQQGTPVTQGQPQQQYAHTAGEYEQQRDDPENTAVDEDPTTSPSGRFDEVVQEMANRAAARHFSTAQDKDIQQIADSYGFDPDQVRSSLQITADFGNYHAANGQIGDYQVPKDYTEVDLSSVGSTDSPAQSGTQTHEAVVPVNTAVRKTAEDLGMDPANVYSALKDSFGGDLSDDYHVSVQGEYHYYLPRELMQTATNHPDPAQQQQQQAQQPTQPGTAMPQPDTSQMPVSSSFKLNGDQLEVLLTRDGKLADQRLAQQLIRQ